jgi:hypothetical protein
MLRVDSARNLDAVYCPDDDVLRAVFIADLCRLCSTSQVWAMKTSHMIVRLVSDNDANEAGPYFHHSR